MNDKKLGQSFPRNPLFPALERTHARIQQLTQSVKASYSQGKPLFHPEFQEQMNHFLQQGNTLLPELSWALSQGVCPSGDSFALTPELVDGLRRIKDELSSKEQHLQQWLPMLRDVYYAPVLKPKKLSLAFIRAKSG